MSFFQYIIRWRESTLKHYSLMKDENQNENTTHFLLETKLW